MSLLKPITIFLGLFYCTFLSCTDVIGQNSSELDYSKYSFSEADVLKVLKDSMYLGLNYQEITAMQPKEVWVFSEKTGISLTKVLIAQSSARADRLEIETTFLDIEEKKIYDDIERKLGIKK